MNVGIVCYASIGGSGIIATELGKALAGRGHRVHVLSSDMPVRFGEYQPRLWFHRVETPAYPLFREPQYLLSLANKIVQVSREERLDIVHAHYAVPHAAAAYLARQILSAGAVRASTFASGTPNVRGAHVNAERRTSISSVPRIITTLHGTDITLLGSDRSYSETVAFCIQQSNGVTAVSNSLRADTVRELGVACDIRVIPNFLDCSVHRRRDAEGLRASLAPDGEKLLIHVSNFRPVKRVTAVVQIFAAVRQRVRSRLLMVGDGPDLGEASRLARSLGIGDEVEFLGEQDQVVRLLSAADVFLLPSAQESFGLAALEAMACEVPVVASRVGGLPEVVEDGVSGFLHAPEDLDGMSQSTLKLLTDDGLHRRAADRSRRIAHERYCDSKIVPLYESYYEEILTT